MNTTEKQTTDEKPFLARAGMPVGTRVRDAFGNRGVISKQDSKYLFVAWDNKSAELPEMFGMVFMDQ